MSTGGYVVFSSYAPIMLVDRGTSHTTAALVISILSWLLIAIIPLGGYLADRTGKKDFMFWGGCLAAAAALVFGATGARAGNDSCREWQKEHCEWKARAIKRYLGGAPQRRAPRLGAARPNQAGRVAPVDLATSPVYQRTVR